MKLLRCNSCLSIFSLSKLMEKKCDCGETHGRYIDDLNAEWSGNGTIFGISNGSFTAARKNQLNRDVNGLDPDKGVTFEAYMIPEKTPNVKKVIPDASKVR